MPAPPTNPAFQLNPKEIAAISNLLTKATVSLGTGNPLNSAQIHTLHSLINDLSILVPIDSFDQLHFSQIRGRLSTHFQRITGISQSPTISVDQSLSVVNIPTIPTTPPIPPILPISQTAGIPPVHPAAIRSPQ